MSLYEPLFTDGGESISVMDQVSDTKTRTRIGWSKLPSTTPSKSLATRKAYPALRFFYGKTQMEVAAEVGITSPVSRLEKNAINQIKKNL